MFITRMEKMALFAKCNTLMIAHTLSAFEIFKSCYLGRKKKKKEQHRIIITMPESQANIFTYFRLSIY